MANKYSKPFLKQVVIRLDFAAPVTVFSRRLPEKLTKTVLKLFPISEPKAVFGKELLITQKETKEKAFEGTIWLFHSKDKGKTMSIGRDNINIAYNSYHSFDILKNDFLTIIEELFGMHKDLQGSRLGLRYINEIDLSEKNLLDWTKYLDKRLLAIFGFPNEPKTICRAFNSLEMNYEDLLVRFQYGMHNPDYPVPIRKKTFILDYDAYYQGPQDLEDITQNIDNFHDKIQSLFEQSISDKLRELMGLVKNG